jgi:type II secretion system protein N
MRMTRIVGYLLYTVAVVASMLWLQFPAAAVKAKAEAELNRLSPDLEWRIGAVGLALPADIRFSEITVSGKGEKEPLLRMDSITLRPDLAAWQKSRTWSVVYEVRLLGGNVSGKLAPVTTGLDCSGELKGLRLDSPGLKRLLAAYGRTISGTLSGSFTGRHDGRQGLLGAMEASLSIGKGTVSLQEPVLGMKQLAFDTLRCTVKRQGKAMQIEGGKLESRLLEAEFSGDLSLAEPAAASTVRLKGGLNPRPEFLASLGGGPIVANLLKSRLQGGSKFPFTVNGTLNEPGIVFAGLPADFTKLLNGRSGQP